MYGLVNRSVEQMVRSRFGETAWATIRAKAGVDIDGFVALKSYPDEMTYRMVGAASEVLGLPPAQVLEAFGEYWVLETAQKGYGDVMKMSGRTFPEFLQNLDQMHSRLSLTFKHYVPPSFECTDVTSDSLVLHYHSSRTGLLPFVVGLVKGLARWFNTPATVEVLQSRDQGADHDALLVKFGA